MTSGACPSAHKGDKLIKEIRIEVYVLSLERCVYLEALEAERRVYTDALEAERSVYLEALQAERPRNVWLPALQQPTPPCLHGCLEKLFSDGCMLLLDRRLHALANTTSCSHY